MAVEKMSISMEGPLGAAIRAAAREAGQPVSTWLAEAAQAKLRSVALRHFLDEYQSQDGTFTDEEIETARRELGYPKKQAGAA